MTDKLETYETGEKLLYTYPVFLVDDLPLDAVERQAVVTDVEESGIVHIEYGDGVTDWFFPAQVMDMFERVTWDSPK